MDQSYDDDFERDDGGDDGERYGDESFEADSPQRGNGGGGGGGGGMSMKGSPGGIDYRDDGGGDMMMDSGEGGPDNDGVFSKGSRRVMENSFYDRQTVKTQMLGERKKFEKKKVRKKVTRQATWRRKMEKSPFLVDLLAENERIDEENRVRIRENLARERALSKRKEKVKNEIILKALAEASDLDALRAEKRLIANEEKRLKALLDLEKTNGHRKSDLLAAQRAERQRKQVHAEYRRQQKKQQQLELREMEVRAWTEE